MVDHLDRTFAALADPGRRAMLSRLAQGPATVGELGEPLDMTLSAVLQHVNSLVDAGLVTTEKHGRTRVVTPCAGGLGATKEWITEHDAAWHGKVDRLGSALDVFFGGPSPASAAPNPALDMKRRRPSASQER